MNNEGLNKIKQCASRIYHSCIGEYVWIENNERGWAKITSAYFDDNELFFQWEQYEYNVDDPIELYDDGEFSINDINKTVFFGDDAKRKCEERSKMYNELQLYNFM